MTTGNSRISLNTKQKLDIVTRIDNGEKQASVCKRFNLSKTTVSTIWKNRESIKRNFGSSEFNIDCKRFRPAVQRDVDMVLLEWFKQARGINIPINSKLLVDKAQSLGTLMGIRSFTATSGLLTDGRKDMGLQ